MISIYKASVMCVSVLLIVSWTESNVVSTRLRIVALPGPGLKPGATDIWSLRDRELFTLVDGISGLRETLLEDYRRY